MSLLQIGSIAIRGQGHRGIYYQFTGRRTNLTSKLSGGSAASACAGNERCVDSYLDSYRMYTRGNCVLSVAQQLLRDLEAEVCPGSGVKAYFRRRRTEDALLEIYRIRSATFDEVMPELNFTQKRTIAVDVQFELEPIPTAEETDVISGDLTVTP